MMHIPSAHDICKSEITLEEGMGNQITIPCVLVELSHKCLHWKISTLGLSQPASCIGYIMHSECICTCHVGIQPSGALREHSSRKSSYWESVTKCRYWIKYYISYTHKTSFVVYCIM